MPPSHPSTLQSLKDAYDQLLKKEAENQAKTTEQNEKMVKMQDDLYNRLHEEKERSTQLTAAFETHKLRKKERMHALMSQIQRAILTDQACAPVNSLQARIYSLGNDQLDAFNEFQLMTTNDKKTAEHIHRKDRARQMEERCEKIRTALQSIESSLAADTTIDGSIRIGIQESTARIEITIQSFLKDLKKLRVVLSRGENMYDHHVEKISGSFDRMQQEIVTMPQLSCVSALEIVETGMQQLALADGRGHEAIAFASPEMLGLEGSREENNN